ncbi:MAG TPA: hypothetical protein VNF68_12990 [Candidatus Baltobacteraceae bacterium]|nr:hypothetical protein [Candidatus Baltobacteraceae bacterium]
MAFLAPILEAAAPSLIAGVAGGVTNGILGGSNSALSGLLGENNAFTTGLEAQTMGAQQQLDLQSTMFDEAMNQQAENMREINTLRDASMAQRKADDGITKKFIQSISE